MNNYKNSNLCPGFCIPLFGETLLTCLHIIKKIILHTKSSSDAGWLQGIETHGVDSLAQEWCGNVQTLLRSNVPVATQVDTVDEDGTFTPALACTTEWNTTSKENDKHHTTYAWTPHSIAQQSEERASTYLHQVYIMSPQPRAAVQRGKQSTSNT